MTIERNVVQEVKSKRGGASYKSKSSNRFPAERSRAADSYFLGRPAPRWSRRGCTARCPVSHGALCRPTSTIHNHHSRRWTPLEELVKTREAISNMPTFSCPFSGSAESTPPPPLPLRPRSRSPGPSWSVSFLFPGPARRSRELLHHWSERLISYVFNA